MAKPETIEYKDPKDERMREIIREEITNALQEFIYIDKYKFNKTVEIEDNKNIKFSGKFGTKIGTATTEKLAFYGNTPVDQPATVSDPSGGVTVDSQARTAINAIIDRLQELGLIA